MCTCVVLHLFISPGAPFPRLAASVRRGTWSSTVYCRGSWLDMQTWLTCWSVCSLTSSNVSGVFEVFLFRDAGIINQMTRHSGAITAGHVANFTQRSRWLVFVVSRIRRKEACDLFYILDNWIQWKASVSPPCFGILRKYKCCLFPRVVVDLLSSDNFISLSKAPAEATFSPRSL